MRPGGGSNLSRAQQWTMSVACAVAAVSITFAFTSADAASASRPQPRRDLGIEQRITSTQSVLRDPLLSDGADSSPGAYLASMRQQLLSFYEKRGFKPAWIGGPMELSRAEEALAVLAHAEDQGLRREDYASPGVQRSKDPSQGKQAAEYDIS